MSEFPWYDKFIKEIGYGGCKNCDYQIDVFRACEWMEQGGDGVVHVVCPRWKKRREERGEANE